MRHPTVFQTHLIGVCVSFRVVGDGDVEGRRFLHPAQEEEEAIVRWSFQQDQTIFDTADLYLGGTFDLSTGSLWLGSRRSSRKAQHPAVLPALTVKVEVLFKMSLKSRVRNPITTASVQGSWLGPPRLV